MKRCLLILLCVAATIAVVKAQNIGYLSCYTSSECITVSDSLLSNSKRIYQLSDTLTSKRDGREYYRLSYVDIEHKRKLQITFRAYIKGGNPDLEIAGRKIYTLYAINGAYLDIFPIWQKYIDPTANIDELTKKYDGARAEFRTDNDLIKYRFSKDNDDTGNWTLLKTF